MKRFFNRAQRAALYIAADGKCQICGTPLSEGWHADHIEPYSLGGATNMANGQALCPACNLKKGLQTLELRTWQKEALQKYNTKNQKDFLVVACPGAGKTTFALTLARQLIDRGEINYIVVVVPSDALRTQWSGNVLVDLAPYKTGQPPRKRDFDGIVTTYQAIANGEITLSLMEHELARPRTRTLVIFDEIHHAGDTSQFGKKISRAFKDADRRLLLSGTPWRENGERIPYTDFDDEGMLKVDYSYTYGDAVRDGVCRGISFPVVNGEVEWSRDGEEFAKQVQPNMMLKGTDVSDVSRALLEASAGGGWMREVLTQAHRRLMSWRQSIPDAGGLIVAKDKNHALGIKKLLREVTGYSAQVVVSGEDEGGSTNDAKAAIGRFRDSQEPWIIAVKMIAEGVDIPRLMVGVYATNVTTNMFFTQVVGRFVRKRRGEDVAASMFVVPTAQMWALATGIEDELPAELTRELEEREEQRSRASAPGVLPVERESPFIFLSSKSDGLGQVANGGETLPGSRVEGWQDFLQASGVPIGYADQLARAADAPEAVEVPKLVPKYKQVEQLKAEANKLVGQVAYHVLGDRSQAHEVRKKMWRLYNRSVKELTIPELKHYIEVLKNWLTTGRLAA